MEPWPILVTTVVEKSPWEFGWDALVALASFAAAIVALYVGLEPRRILRQQRDELRQRAANAVGSIVRPAIEAIRSLHRMSEGPIPFPPTKEALAAVNAVAESRAALRRFDSHWHDLSGTQLLFLLVIERELHGVGDLLQKVVAGATNHAQIQAFKGSVDSLITFRDSLDDHVRAIRMKVTE